MQERNEKQSEPTETTSDNSSTSVSMTTQSLLELKRLLRDVNRLMVRTAIASVPTKDYVTRPFKRRLMKAQVKHTNEMLKALPISERVLLLEELRSANESQESTLILPAGHENSKE